MPFAIFYAVHSCTSAVPQVEPSGCCACRMISCAANGKCSGVLHIESSAVHSQTGLFVGTWTCGDQWNWQVHSFEGPVWQIEAQPWQI